MRQEFRHSLYYGTFTTRDLEAYDHGLPFLRQFTTAGHRTSRCEAPAGSDAIHVRSCWDGMVASDTQFF